MKLANIAYRMGNKVVSNADCLEAAEVKTGQRLMTSIASGGLSFSSACFNAINTG